MKRCTVKEMSSLTGLHVNTIRRWADLGIIESRRDFRGWRFFPRPMETVRRVRGLLDGEIELERS